MTSKCGIVTISFPVNPIVKSGRKMNVFTMSKVTVSASSSSTRFVFSFHSLLGVCAVEHNGLRVVSEIQISRVDGWREIKNILTYSNMNGPICSTRGCVCGKFIEIELKSHLSDEGGVHKLRHNQMREWVEAFWNGNGFVELLKYF